jgi:hypothetical protein
MSPEDYRGGTAGPPRSASTAGHDCERVRRFTEEHAARILRASTRTEARDWAHDHPSTLAAPPRLGDAFAHALRGTIAPVTPLKGTEAVASPLVRGTLRGQP